MPQAPVTTATIASGIDGVPPFDAAGLQSDDYLRFLVEELKPFVDAVPHLSLIHI